MSLLMFLTDLGHSHSLYNLLSSHFSNCPVKIYQVFLIHSFTLWLFPGVKFTTKAQNLLNCCQLTPEEEVDLCGLSLWTLCWTARSTEFGACSADLHPNFDEFGPKT